MSEEPADQAEVNKHALTMLGSALIPALLIAMTNGEETTVPVPSASLESSLGTSRPARTGSDGDLGCVSNKLSIINTPAMSLRKGEINLATHATQAQRRTYRRDLEPRFEVSEQPQAS